MFRFCVFVVSLLQVCKCDKQRKLPIQTNSSATSLLLFGPLAKWMSKHSISPGRRPEIILLETGDVRVMGPTNEEAEEREATKWYNGSTRPSKKVFQNKLKINYFRKGYSIVAGFVPWPSLWLIWNKSRLCSSYKQRHDPHSWTMMNNSTGNDCPLSLQLLHIKKNRRNAYQSSYGEEVIQLVRSKWSVCDLQQLSASLLLLFLLVCLFISVILRRLKVHGTRHRSGARVKSIGVIDSQWWNPSQALSVRASGWQSKMVYNRWEEERMNEAKACNLHLRFPTAEMWGLLTLAFCIKLIWIATKTVFQSRMLCVKWKVRCFIQSREGIIKNSHYSLD